jgi:hypothetical protein
MKTASMNAAVSIIFAVILMKCQHSTAQMEYEPDVDTRLPYTIAIGKQAEVRLRDGYPVTLDCHVLAEASFGCDYNRSSIMWFQSESIIRDNSTIRGISISSDRQRLLISTLSISSGAEQIGTEAVYTCKVCGKAWGKSGSLPDCKKFKTQVKAKSPPILKCPDPYPPDITGGFIYLHFGCDLCLERGESVFLVVLACQPTTNRQPTNCTIRNPDGEMADELDDGDTFIPMGNTLAVSNNVFKNPESPAPPTVLGDWSCTCTNSDGTVTATSYIGTCVPQLVTKTVTADFGISVTAPKGSIVILKCITNDLFNEEVEMFRKFGGTVRRTVYGENKELIINGLSKENRGTYCCKVSNDKGKAKACSKVAIGK